MKYINLYRTLVKEFNTSPKSRHSSIVGQYVYRPLGLVLAPVFIKSKISGNQVTLIGFVFGWAANILFLIGQRELFLIASILYVIFAILDYTDGLVARHFNTSSYYGRLIDAINGILVSGFTPLCVTIGVISAGLPTFGLSNLTFLIVGALACIINLITKLGNRTYEVVYKDVLLLKDRNGKIKNQNKEKKRSLIEFLFFNIPKTTAHLLLFILALFKIEYFFPVLVLAMSSMQLFRFIIKVFKKGPKELNLPKR